MRNILLSASVGFIVFLCVFHPANARALTADQLLIVTNKKVPESNQLAAYYMKRRSVPAGEPGSPEHRDQEDISRQDV